MASNKAAIADDFGEYSDWIELTNTGTEAVDLAGWRLTDDASKTSKWVFPSRILEPQTSCIVWASDRNRRLAGAALHTNFKLSASGEYLGLYRPDGSVAHQYAPAFPQQLSDVSYGVPGNVAITLLAQGASGEAGVPESATDYSTNFTNWQSVIPSMSNSSWSAVQTGVGFDQSNTLYADWIAPSGNLSSKMYGKKRNACLRLPFVMEPGMELLSLKLRMKYDDGFIAWINGVQVASDAAPASPAWDSLATLNRVEDLNKNWTEHHIPLNSVSLLPGTNILAVQGFNITASSSDFLILPELDAILASEEDAPASYFSVPTPGLPNGSGGVEGPLIFNPTQGLPRPSGNPDSDPQVVTMQVVSTAQSIDTASIQVFWKVMHGTENSVIMRDDGGAPDALAGDGIYSAYLPMGSVGAGQMIRWRFEAADTAGHITRSPPFLDPLDSDQYYGTVAMNSDEDTSALPLLHWFIEPAKVSAAGTLSGARASVYYLGRFYDNIFFNRHGQSTAGFAKKSFNVDFNNGNRFVWQEGVPLKVKDINLLTNYADKTRIRNSLAHDTGRLTGAVYHFAFPVRIQLNGSFHGVWDMVEDGDDRLLQRNGLDPEGAFYKMYNKMDSSTSNVQKKTRKTENNVDLAALISGLAPAKSLLERRQYAYDNVDLPATINYLVTRVLNSDRDHGHKNYYLYRDTNITREWQPVIWDVDLSWGHDWNASSGYTDNTLGYTNPLTAGSTENRLYTLIWNAPELRTMFLRRMRTVMDTILEPPGTVNGERETWARALVATIDPNPTDPSPETDGDRDFVKWGSWGSPQLRPREELERVISDYLAPRRSFLFDTNPATRPTVAGSPIPDIPQAVVAGDVVIDSLDYFPASGTQAEEYVVLRNTTTNAVDMSGWTLDGAITHTFHPGTVIPPGAGTPAVEYIGLLHVVKDAVAFRARATGPKGGQYRFIQGNYSGQLSSRGETLFLRSETGATIHSYTWEADPTPHQLALRISEIHYAPLGPTSAELTVLPGLIAGDFEFLELVNIGDIPLNLEGLTFREGITYTFPAGSIAPGWRIILAKSPEAFALRYPHVTAPVYGPYDGQLSNTGELLECYDPTGEKVLSFEYKDGWYPATAGVSGHSLVSRDPGNTAYDQYGNPLSWAISETVGGTPGQADTAYAQAYLGWDNEYFTKAERSNPAISGLDADPDGDGRSNLHEYAFATDPRLSDAPQSITFEWASIAGQSYPALRFRRAARALDLQFDLVASSSIHAPLSEWAVLSTTPHDVQPLGPFVENALFVDPAPPPPGQPRYYRIRVTQF